MKNLFACLLLITLFSCQRPECGIKATIVGVGKGSCACCGGWLIKTGRDTTRYFYYGDNSFLEKHAKNGFPFDVYFEFKEHESPCKFYAKEITCVALVE